MKNLFNDISQEEKNRILEMHSGKKYIISEQPAMNASSQVAQQSGVNKPVTTSVSGSEMEKVLLQGGNGLKGIESAVNFCKSKNVPNNHKIDRLEELILQAINGPENPLNLAGGSPGLEKVGQIMDKNIANTTELCSLLKHYENMGEDFLTAMKGEINTKLDSTGAASFILSAINKINRRG